MAACVQSLEWPIGKSQRIVELHNAVACVDAAHASDNARVDYSLCATTSMRFANALRLENSHVRTFASTPLLGPFGLASMGTMPPVR
jgi:hypothetical protein